ncbi:Phospholipase D alpha 4 [Glycine soja]
MNLIWQKQNWMTVFASLLYQLFPSNVDEIGVWSLQESLGMMCLKVSTLDPSETVLFQLHMNHEAKLYQILTLIDKILQTATLPPIPTSTPQLPEFKVRAHHNANTTSTEVSHKCICANGNPAYVTIKIDNQKFAKTSQEINRVWNQTFQIHYAHPADSCITITLKTSRSSVLGKFHIQTQQLLKKGEH